jgi:hypothetical protein
MDWLSLLRKGTVEGSCEHGNEPLASMNSLEIPE